MSLYGSTLTSGIQDIAALLPLLGTEQCEEHVGSALTDGYLFSAVTPLSLFGTLGLAKAGIKTLFASIFFPRVDFLGAEKVRDAGFQPSGKNLALIMMDPDHPKRFLAETRFDAVLETSGIADNKLNIEVITFDHMLPWLLKSATATVAFSVLNAAAYIHLTLAPNRISRTTICIIVTTRIIGAALLAYSIPTLIRSRIYSLVTARSCFWELDRLVRPVSHELRTCIQDNNPKDKRQFIWNSEVSSERCLESLRSRLAAMQLDEKSTDDPEIKALRTEFEKRYRRNSLNMSQDFHPFIQLSVAVLIFYMVIGIVGCIIGYVGCFSIVQGSPSSIGGPLTWLGVEVSLSLLRLLIWSANPDWDDDTVGMQFKELENPTKPFTTHPDEFIQRMREDGTLPFRHAPDFLESIKKHFHRVTKEITYSDISFLYTIVPVSPVSDDNLQTRRIPYITMFHNLRRTAHIYWEDNDKKAHVKAGLLESNGQYVKLGNEIDPEDMKKYWIEHPGLLSSLSDHYTKIAELAKASPSSPTSIAWDLKEVQFGDNADHSNFSVRLCNVLPKKMRNVVQHLMHHQITSNHTPTQMNPV